MFLISRYQGNGYATEAARALVNDAFTNNNAHRVIARCNVLNTASWKLLERLGMRREGHLLQNVWFKRMRMVSRYGRTRLNMRY